MVSYRRDRILGSKEMRSSVFRVGWLGEFGDFHQRAGGKVLFLGWRCYGVGDNCFEFIGWYFCSANIAGSCHMRCYKVSDLSFSCFVSPFFPIPVIQEICVSYAFCVLYLNHHQRGAQPNSLPNYY